MVAVMQFRKGGPADQGRERQAAICAFAAFPELKTVFLVDEDVDIFDPNDVMWAMATRYQADVDTIIIPGVRCHPLDPSQRPDMSPSIIAPGTSCKTIFDCTAPFALKDRFKRAKFKEVDYKKFLSE
jgi:4-hydroxy-3-polyprenylbenzoate decarboxylase